jgi:YHS domain-containing protein
VRLVFALILLSLLHHRATQVSTGDDCTSCNPYSFAFQGNDVVSYFDGKNSTAGSRKFKVWADGQIYLFSSQENRERFVLETEEYKIKIDQMNTAQYSFSCRYSAIDQPA